MSQPNSRIIDISFPDKISEKQLNDVTNLIMNIVGTWAVNNDIDYDPCITGSHVYREDWENYDSATAT